MALVQWQRFGGKDAQVPVYEKTIGPYRLLVFLPAKSEGSTVSPDWEWELYADDSYGAVPPDELITHHMTVLDGRGPTCTITMRIAEAAVLAFLAHDVQAPIPELR